MRVFFSTNQVFADYEEIQATDDSNLVQESTKTRPDEENSLEQKLMTPMIDETTILENAPSKTELVQNKSTEIQQVANQDVVLSEKNSTAEESPKATSWIAEELDGNRAFIDATVTATKKAEEQITLEDLAQIKTLIVKNADCIPEKISDYINLASLSVTNGTVTEIPESLYTLNQTLSTLTLSNNHFVTLPAKLFDDTFWKKKLIVIIPNNQIVSDIPENINASGMLQFNSKNNMLEHYNYGDYYGNLQSRLTFKGTAPTIKVPVGYDFNQAQLDTTNLKAYSAEKGYQDLFPGHEFVYYDAGTSPEIMTNGVTTNIGRGKIKIKSAFATNTNRFAQTEVTVVVALSGKVISHFVDETGKPLADDKVTTGFVGDRFETEALPIENYEVTSIKGNTVGFYTEADQEVTYVYKQLDGKPVYVHYQDAVGNELIDPIALNGKMGDTYETNPQEITGYDLIETPDNHTGLFTNTAQNVIYRYSKTPEKSGNVIVTYLTEDGEALTEKVVLTGIVGTAYATEEKQFDGYKLKEVTGNPTGDFLETEQMVSFIYQKIEPSEILPPISPIPGDDAEVEGNTNSHSTTHSSSESNSSAEVVQSIASDSLSNENDQREKLPQTGEKRNSMFIILGVIIIAIGVGYFYITNRKSK